MKKLLFTSLVVVIALSFSIFYGKHIGIFDTPTPVKKWRVAYYEGGPYLDYNRIFAGTAKALIEADYIKSKRMPEFNGEKNDVAWHWLSTHVESDRIEFVKDAFYSADWNEEKRKEIVDKLMHRLTKTKDIDLLICAGTWAGQDFANDQHDVPTVVISTSDPVLAEIITSKDDSGFDHVIVPYDPDVYERQLVLFHEIVKFDRLGIAYEDTIDGRSYAAINVVERVAKERGFELTKCYTVSDIGDIHKETESVSSCFEELSGRVDAIYVTQQGGIRLETLHELVEIAIDNKIPTFSQAGSIEVKYGFLASISQADYDFIGEFNAEIIKDILNDAIPRYLPHTFTQKSRLTLNLRTAELIGFKPTLLMLGAADELYDTIYIPRSYTHAH